MENHGFISLVVTLVVNVFFCITSALGHTLINFSVLDAVGHF